MKRIVLCAIAAVLALALVGCGQQEAAAPAADNTAAPEQQAPASDAAGADDAAPGPVTFTDDLGNEVTVDNPQRVVACMGSFANAWELAGGTLVGVSDDALQAAGWTIASPDVATVGDFASVNLEAIIALDPDFVIMTSGTGGRGGDSSQADLRDALVGSGIPVAYFQVTTFDDYLRLLVDNFNALAVQRMMCRDQVNVDVDGRLYDCEVNHVLELPIQLPADPADPEGPTRDATVADLARGPLPARALRTNPVCYSCAAGFGSSCGGSLVHEREA